jgi:xylose isomerase
MTRYPYAARLNSFYARPELTWPGRTDQPTTFDLIERAASVEGLTAVDINYPQQAEGIDPGAMRAQLGDLGLALNGYAMRYNGDPAFIPGAFTSADPSVRQRAIDLSRRGLDEAREAGGSMLTLWLGQDGVDHPFEREYGRLWELEVEGIRAVAEHDPDFPVSIEYKPNEPRARSVLPNIAATLLAIDEAGAPNLGITLDLAHVYYGD